MYKNVKRKRAYHRALKRGEDWAKLEKEQNRLNSLMMSISAEINVSLYREPESCINTCIGLKEFLDNLEESH